MREAFGPGKMQITPDAKRLLLARLGADRALSRAEIDKLVLYAHGKTTIEESDVEAAVGDAAELALDRIVMAAASGADRRRRWPNATAALPRARARSPSSPRCSGISCACTACAARSTRAGPWRTWCARSGRRSHFKQREAIEQQCRSWTLPQLTAALARIADAAKAARLNSALEGTLAENLLLDIGAIARAMSRSCPKAPLVALPWSTSSTTELEATSPRPADFVLSLSRTARKDIRIEPSRARPELRRSL